MLKIINQNTQQTVLIGLNKKSNDVKICKQQHPDKYITFAKHTG